MRSNNGANGPMGESPGPVSQRKCDSGYRKADDSIVERYTRRQVLPREQMAVDDDAGTARFRVDSSHCPALWARAPFYLLGWIPALLAYSRRPSEN